ncbi:MAG: amidohydrolase [Schleiferiaceae bacterium]|nr:amidohydrolase [Schleiferiaceae bacterium]
MRNLSHTFIRFVVYNLLFIFSLSNCTPAEEFDLLLTNFELHTPYNTPESNGEQPQYSIGIKDGKIASILDHSRGKKFPKAKETLSLEGQHLYPGFIDAHGHLFGYARTLSTVNLIGAASKQECLERIKAYVDRHPNEHWIIGRGWDQNDWTPQEFPTAKDLAEFTDKLIYLTRIDGHAAWVNQAVLDTFSISSSTTIEGGQILDGVLVDNAESLVTLPKLTNRYWRAALLQAQDSLVKYGLTAMTDAGLTASQILLLDSLQAEGQFHLFVNAMISNNEEDLAYFESNGPIEKPLLRVKSVKAYLDGALGSRGALLRDPYHDLPDHYGLPLLSPRQLDVLRERCVKNGWQLCVHAIGDSAHHVLLESFSQLDTIANLRFRVEHAQIMTPEDSAYYSHPNIIASVQPTHATSDMYWAEDRLGPHRIQHAYSYRRIFNASNERVAFGTDFPIEHIDPLATFFAATTRQDKNHWPEGGFLPEQTVSPGMAIYAMTSGAAYSAFGEEAYGSIALGQQANFTVLTTDLWNHSPDLRESTRVVKTIVGGEVLYDRTSFKGQ